MQPQVEVKPSNGIVISIPGWGSLFLLLLAAEILGVIIQKLFFGNKQDKNKLLNLAADAIEAAEPFVPVLRASSLDNYLVSVIRAYVNNNPKMQNYLEDQQIKPEELADALKSNPELTAKLFSVSPTNAAKMLEGVARTIKNGSSPRKA